MPKTSVIIKDTARKTLRGKWVEVMAASLILLAVLFSAVLIRDLVISVFKPVMLNESNGLTALGTVTSLLLAVIMLSFSLPILQGIIRWFWCFILESPRPFSEMFYYFSTKKLWLKAMALHIRIAATCILSLFISLLPALVIYNINEFIVSGVGGYDLGVVSMLVTLVTYILGVCGVMAAVGFVLRYALSAVIFVIDDKLSPQEILELSKKLTLGKGKTGFVLLLSFLPLIALSILGVTLLYTLPFMLVSYVVAARFAITRHRIDAAKQGQNPLL